MGISNLACGIFIDLQKTFDNVYYQVLVKNWNDSNQHRIVINPARQFNT